MAERSELEKMLVVKEISQAIGKFLDWIQTEKGYRLAGYSEDERDERLYPVHVNTEVLLAEFFGIDLEKAEEEKRKLLASLAEATSQL